MRSHTEKTSTEKPTAEIFALCLLLASSLQIIETLLPKIPVFPWLRFGFAYLIILPFLLRYGVKHTFWLFLSRNLITLIYGAQLFSSFLISTISGSISLLIIGGIGTFAYNRKWIGLLGLSIVMSLAFNLIQLVTVFFLFIQHSGFFFQITPILGWSLISGGVIAFLIFKGEKSLESLFDVSNTPFSANKTDISYVLTSREKLLFLVAIAGLLSAILVQNTYFQVGLLVLFGVLTRFKAIKKVFLAWPFFIFIAWFHLFRTDGVYLVGDWITKEGLAAFIYYTLRTINVIFSGHLLARFIPALLNRWKQTLPIRGMITALPLLPALFGISISMGKTFFHQLRHRQFENLFSPIISKLRAELTNTSNPHI